MANNRAAGPRKQNRRPKKLNTFYFVFALLCVIGLVGHTEIAKHASAKAEAEQAAEQASSIEAKHKSDLFAGQVNQLLASNPGDTIGVATASNETGVQTYGSTAAFDTASSEKVITAVDFLHHVEDGSASLNQQIDGQSASYLLKIMIVNSDDTAWADLDEYLTHTDMLAYASSIGFSDYNPDVNTFPASDMALLLQKLYDGSLLNSSHKSLLMGYLNQANYRQYIVAAVPTGYNVYHKVGFDGDFLNDSAIITKGHNYVVLVIFTNGNGSYDWPNRQQIMQTITKDAIAAYL